MSNFKKDAYLKLADVEEAYINWERVFGNQYPENQSTVFYDFIDPVRQTEIRDMLGWRRPEGEYTFTQIVRRVEALKSPYYHAFLKANADRVAVAVNSWGKTWIVEPPPE